jgi:hypothetical protein
MGASLPHSFEQTEGTHPRRSAMKDSLYVATAGSCLGRTCLKWGADGELTARDLNFVMERLAQVDQQVTGLELDTLDREPCPSIS